MNPENMETANLENNLAIKQHEGEYRPELNWRDIPPVENSCPGLHFGNTACHRTDKNCSEQTAMILNIPSQAQPEKTIDDLTVGDRASKMSNTTTKVTDSEDWHEVEISEPIKGREKNLPRFCIVGTCLSSLR